MISITKANIPDYLVGSDFYNALCSEDTEEFTIPEANLKLSPTVENLSDLRHLLNTLRYWGTQRYPDELLLFALTKRDELCPNEFRLTMYEFKLFPELVRWLDSLQQIKELDNNQELDCSHFRWYFCPVAGMGSIPILIECLASNNEALNQHALTVLQSLAAFSSKTVDFVASQLCSGICKIRPLDSLPHASQHYIAQLLSNMYNKVPPTDSESFAYLLPILLFFFKSSDEELLTVSSTLLAKGVGYLDNNNNISALLQHNTAPKIVSLLVHSNVAIQDASIGIVCRIVRAKSIFLPTIVNLKMLPALGATLKKSSRLSPEARKKIVRTFEHVAIYPILYNEFSQIRDVKDQVLIRELLPALAAVIALGDEPEYQLQCACLLVFIYSKCSNDDLTSDFYNAWRVCKQTGMIEKASTVPWLLKEIKIELLPA